MSCSGFDRGSAGALAEETHIRVHRADCWSRRLDSDVPGICVGRCRVGARLLDQSKWRVTCGELRATRACRFRLPLRARKLCWREARYDSHIDVPSVRGVVRETSPDHFPFSLGADGGANTEVGSKGGTCSWAPPCASSAEWYAWGRQRPRARTSASASQSLAFREGWVGRTAPRAITLTLANGIGSAPHVHSPPCSGVGCISQGRCLYVLVRPRMLAGFGRALLCDDMSPRVVYHCSPSL